MSVPGLWGHTTGKVPLRAVVLGHATLLSLLKPRSDRVSLRDLAGYVPRFLRGADRSPPARCTTDQAGGRPAPGRLPSGADLRRVLH